MSDNCIKCATVKRDGPDGYCSNCRPIEVVDKLLELSIDYFDVVLNDACTEYEIRCTKCRKGWAWPANKEMTIGTRLHLLNHARSHEVTKQTNDSDS